MYFGDAWPPGGIRYGVDQDTGCTITGGHYLINNNTVLRNDRKQPLVMLFLRMDEDEFIDIRERHLDLRIVSFDKSIF